MSQNISKIFDARGLEIISDPSVLNSDKTYVLLNKQSSGGLRKHFNQVLLSLSDFGSAIGLDGNGVLLSANNLDDLSSVSIARTNLGLGSMALQNNSTVSITGGAINGTIIGGGTPAAGTFTVSTSGNISTTGNTISSIDTNGNIILSPNGTGKVQTSAGHTAAISAANDIITKGYADANYGGGAGITNGTYTPSLDADGSSPSVTYSLQTGQWQKVGDWINVTFQITINTISGGSGIYNISLPETSDMGTGNEFIGSVLLQDVTYSTNITYYVVRVQGGDNVAKIYGIKDGGATVALQTGSSNLVAGSVIFGQIRYKFQ